MTASVCGHDDLTHLVQPVPGQPEQFHVREADAVEDRVHCDAPLGAAGGTSAVGAAEETAADRTAGLGAPGADHQAHQATAAGTGPRAGHDAGGLEPGEEAGLGQPQKTLDRARVTEQLHECWPVLVSS